jgi:hypothetical protein
MTERDVQATDPGKKDAVAQLENYGAPKTNSRKISTKGKIRKSWLTLRIAVTIKMIGNLKWN